MVNAILVLGKNDDELRKNVERLKSAVVSTGCNLRKIPFEQKNGFISISPYGDINDDMEKIAGRVTLLSTFLGGFFNLKEGFSDEQGYYFAKDIDGGLMILDLCKRDKDRTNSNIVAVGSPGKGKSTAVKKIILNEYMLGTKILIIDSEREYDDITKELGGDWINLGGSSKGKINPLEIKPIPISDEKEEEHISPVALHLQNLEVFFSLCFPELTERQKTILNQNLIKLYEKFNIIWETDITNMKPEEYPIIDDLVQVLKENKTKENNQKK